ncbi:MAG TPA: hypothetical protein PKH38_01905 [Anaerolineaceae bacterium]|jgi:hypothetical protein|nr:hypothetical protein [Anaerolineaceae bacterium]HOF24845.1 hypothetical protein [Anaerolineaceae bacterium]HOR77622.1 hypothetical protein [Anaerolineaceae bacterium]HPK26810.1 hypothetical protein [Anaerolineaceae bacterium]
MNNKITVIEGPTPTFEPIEDAQVRGSTTTWTAGILEGPYLYTMAMTTLRTFDSESLIDRCTRAWQQNLTMFLEYRDEIGLTRQAPIMAARAINFEEGDAIQLWVRQELQSDPDDFFDDEDETNAQDQEEDF